MNEKIIAGLDIGNGYLKGLISTGLSDTPDVIDMPSCVSTRKFVPTDLRTPPSEYETAIRDIYNEMDLTFSSACLADSMGRTLFGRRALSMGGVMEFDVDAVGSKSEDELSYFLILGCLAGKALQSYWDENHILPTDILTAHVELALALPIDEYVTRAKIYAAAFYTGSHVMTFYNFEDIVRVEVVIDHVTVVAEGSAAQFAINRGGLPLIQVLTDGFTAMTGRNLPTGVTPEVIFGARNTVGIDIGEGTVNFPVFRDGKFSAEMSGSYHKGYGNVLSEALSPLMENRILDVRSRKGLSEYLLVKPSAITQRRYNRVCEVVNGIADNFCDELLRRFSLIWSKVGSFVEVVYVYGGGSGPLRDMLYPKLVSGLGGGQEDPDMMVPILYLDTSVSRRLNSEGLYTIASDSLAYQVHQAATETVSED